MPQTFVPPPPALAALAAAVTVLLGAPVPAVAQAAPAAACPPLLSHTFARLQDEKPQALCQYRGKVLLVVNTASYCGFTPQYQGLEALHSRYKGRDFAVLGFPSNDFAQEKGSNKEIAEFCENTFGVKFPMFAASSVRGDKANPLFRQLAAATGTTPKWNFYKYLVGRDGKPIAAYASTTAPDSAALVRDIEAALAK